MTYRCVWPVQFPPDGQPTLVLTGHFTLNHFTFHSCSSYWFLIIYSYLSIYLNVKNNYHECCIWLQFTHFGRAKLPGLNLQGHKMNQLGAFVWFFRSKGCDQWLEKIQIGQCGSNCSTKEKRAAQANVQSTRGWQGETQQKGTRSRWKNLQQISSALRIYTIVVINVTKQLQVKWLTDVQYGIQLSVRYSVFFMF